MPTRSSARSTALLAVLLGAFASAADGQTLVRRHAIGCESCTGPEQLTRIRDVTATEDGGVIVLDESAPMIRRFDAKAKLAWSGGRAGEGPGEFRSPVRASWASGGLDILDTRNKRITSLDAAGRAVATVALEKFIGSVAARTGQLIAVNDNFRGTLQLLRWKRGDAVLTPFGAPVVTGNNPMETREITIPSVAIAPDGGVALIADADAYRIRRFTPDGKAAADYARSIPRPRRTPEEEAEVRGSATRLSGTPGARTESKVTLPPGTPLGLKPHFDLDALGYDGTGRLWVKTMRGGLDSTVFDVFAPNGSFLKSLTIAGKVGAFSIAGSYLAAAGETDDGIPQVVLWEIRG